MCGKTNADDLESYNKEAFTNWNEKVLEACPGCARTFLPDRLEVHMRSCKGAQGVSKSPNPVKGKTLAPPEGVKGTGMSRASPSPNKTIVRPKTVVCYICGREYGSASIEIHLKTCI